MAVIENFARALIDRANSGLSDEAIRETRRTILNVVGTAIGASHATETDALVAASALLGGKEVVPLGRSEQLDRYSAALEIGFAAHFDDFDDTHLATVIHPGAATLGAWYVLGQLEAISPEVALTSFAMGVESQLRVGLAMTPSHYDDGWHITGTCGVIGAAVAAGIAFGFDADRLAQAIGLASQMTLGHREAFGTPIKPFHPGKAASNGLFAAELARRGVRAGADGFESAQGYFAVLSHEWDTSLLEPDAVASQFVLLDNTYKPYPCGIVAHPAIEAASNLHPAVLAAGSEIEQVVVRCNPLVPELMGRPSASTGLEARFCAIHGVAVGLLDGAGGLAQFSDERATDPVVEELRRRTRLEPDEACPRDAARVTVSFTDGTIVTNEVLVASGSTDRPLTDTQLEEKFTALVEPIRPGRAKAIAGAVASIGTGSTIVDLVDAVDGQSTEGARRSEVRR